jgi:hypothetical protein
MLWIQNQRPAPPRLVTRAKTPGKLTKARADRLSMGIDLAGQPSVQVPSVPNTRAHSRTAVPKVLTGSSLLENAADIPPLLSRRPNHFTLLFGELTLVRPDR